MIGFIGAGHMAAAILSGIVKNGTVPAAEMAISNPHENKLENFKKCFGIEGTTDNCAVAQKSDLLFLCVKPQKLDGVLEEIKEILPPDVMIVSVVAGRSIASIREGLGRPVKTVRVMPNTPAAIGEGISAVCADADTARDERYALLLRILAGMGAVSEVEEPMIDIAGQLAGASPAWLFAVIEAMADGGVQQGMPRDLAYRFAAAGVAGAGKLALAEGGNPGRLKDQVTSPGGTTIEGLRILEERAVRGAFFDAVIAACEKAKKL